MTIGTAAVVLKLWVTTGAGVKLPSPACEAFTEIAPAPVIVSVSLEIVAGPVTEKLTESPEDALAIRATGASVAECAGMGAKEMAWFALAMLKERVTGAAGDRWQSRTHHPIGSP